MDDVTPADFSFRFYQLPEFSGRALDIVYDNINLTFDPTGSYDENAGEFKLTLKLTAIGQKNAQGTEIITAKLNAYFDFPQKPLFENIPTFFYSNCIAIVFPYFRGFISNLTLQANAPLIVLPTLNLSALEGALRANTTVVKGAHGS